MSFILRPPECVNLAGAETGRSHLSHTSIGTLLSCQERYNLHYERSLRPAVVATPLAVGKAFADALERDDPQVAWDTLHEQALVERDRNVGNPWVTLPSDQELEIQAQIAREAARCYLHRYGAHRETREVEMRVRIRNPREGGRFSLTHDLLGRVDALNFDEALLIEDKLASSQMRGNLSQRVRLDRQISIGCYLVWRVYGVVIREIQYRITLKPAIRQKQGETHADFLDRIAFEYESRPDHYLVEPPPCSRDESDFLRLERELWRWAETIRESQRDGTWPRNSSACLDFGGCRFLPMCAGEPGAEHTFRFSGEGKSQPLEVVAA